MKKLLLVALLTMSSTSFAGGWNYSKTVDSMTDAEVRVASVRANSNDATLVIRCTDDNSGVVSIQNFDVFIMTNKVIDTSDSSIVFRIDKNKAVKIPKTTHGTNRTAEFITNPSQEFIQTNIIAPLKTGTSVKVQVPIYVGNSKVYTFSLSGSTSAINKVMKDCPSYF